MTPNQFAKQYARIIEANDRTPIMLMGAPGIGKSSLMAQVAQQFEFDVIDLRLGQVPPSDIRGLPIIENGRSCYARPDWLPETGQGILFLDELTNAPPTVQGLAQQLLLDRKVGEHPLGDGWFIAAAGNLREHGAATHGMPTPVANRMYHFRLEADFDSWKAYALKQGLHSDVVGFLSFRPELLFKLERKELAFPTPRSWEGASRLHSIGMQIDPAVGTGCAEEFRVYCEVVTQLPDLSLVLSGEGKAVAFPREISARYAVCVGLAMRVQDEHEALLAFRWLNDRAGPEWVQMYVSDCVVALQRLGRSGHFAAMVGTEPTLEAFIESTISAVFA